MNTINQPPSPQPAVQQTPVPPKPSVDSKTLLIAVIMFVVVMIGLITYVLAARTKPTSQLLTISPTLPQPSPTPVDKTANWKTYRNTQYGFSFSYPPDSFNAREDNKKIIDPEHQLLRLGTFSLNVPNSDAFIWLVIWSNPKKLSAEQWWNTNYDTYYANVKDHIDGKPVNKEDFITSIENFGNVNSFYAGNGKFQASPHFINHNDIIIEVTSTIKLNQILSTFQFSN